MYKCKPTIGHEYSVTDSQMEVMKGNAASVTEHDDGTLTLAYTSGSCINATPLTPQHPEWSLEQDSEDLRQLQ